MAPFEKKQLSLEEVDSGYLSKCNSSIAHTLAPALMQCRRVLAQSDRVVSNSFGNFENDLAFAKVVKNAAGFYEQLGVFAGALVVAVPVISSLAWNGCLILKFLHSVSVRG